MSDAPPSYEQATGSSAPQQNLQVPGGSGGNAAVPLDQRRSMEDEGRSLPEGWVRQYDHTSNHQFFVDTKANPPRSIWHHPYDDETYLQSLSTEERERLEELQRQPPSRDDIIHAESDIEDPHHEPKPPAYPHQSGQSGTASQGQDNRKFGRKLKDKLTGSTHEERVAARKRRDEETAEFYRRHLVVRQAMQRAMETGQPQLLGKDRDGHDVYMEPPVGGPFSNFTGRGRMYNPYNQQGSPYQQTNTRFIQFPAPQGMYARPGYGRPGYGGYGYGRPGMGSGMGMPVMGGLLGGAMLGSLLF